MLLWEGPSWGLYIQMQNLALSRRFHLGHLEWNIHKPVNIHVQHLPFALQRDAAHRKKFYSENFMWDRTSCGISPSGMSTLEPLNLGWEDNTERANVELSLPHLCQSVLCPIQRWTQSRTAVIYFRRTTLSADQSLSELHMLQVFPLALGSQSSKRTLEER